MSTNKHMIPLFGETDAFYLQNRLMNILCTILLILGIVGNVSGLFIFSSSRRTWRISSIYACLATCSSITNLFCVIRYASILHSTSRHFLFQLVGHTWWACKVFEFSFSFRVISSWITLFWMFERLICVSTTLKKCFNRWISYKFQFIIPVIIVIIILGCVIGPPVYMFQPKVIPGNNTTNSTIHMMHCDISANASIKWQEYFHEVRFDRNYHTIHCLFSELIPAGAIILFNIYIIHHLIRTYRRLRRRRKKQSRTTSWMNIVLILHSLLFLGSFLSHIAGHFMNVEAHETWWVLLSVLMNCSLNFYMYCLSGKAFRNEIRRLIHRVKTQLLRKLQPHQYQNGQDIIAMTG